jgi:hypothetical protein
MESFAELVKNRRKECILENIDSIAGLRLASHHLSATQLQTPASVVSWLGAIQAQDFNMAKWAIGIRLPACCTIKAVEEAFNRGDFLRTHVMRPTWHFVSPENIRWMSALSAEKIKSSSGARDRYLEITEALYDKTNRIIRKALEGHKNLTREALGEALESAKIKVDASRMVHFMMRAEVEGIICSGALQGKTQTYALLDERVPPTKPLPKEEALARLARIYFKSHSPATVQDFVWWSGLSLTEARSGLETVKSELIAETIEGQTYWINPEYSGTSCFSSVGKQAYLLPAFDEYIISYRDRSAIVTQGNKSKVITSNGIFSPTIIVNGKVAGSWKNPANTKNVLQLAFFEQPEEEIKKAVEKAAERLKAAHVIAGLTRNP